MRASTCFVPHVYPHMYSAILPAAKFVDPTPWNNEELVGGLGSGSAAGKVDLLTALAHALGRLLGPGEDLADPASVMAPSLPACRPPRAPRARPRRNMAKAWLPSLLPGR
jgi:hypothetical protein